MSPAVQRTGGRVEIAPADVYRVMDPMFEGLRVILAARGEAWSPAYIQGVAGTGFRVAGICPCAPTCGTAISIAELVSVLGYAPVRLTLATDGDALAESTERAIDTICAEIDAGRPALVFHAFTTAEWDVVLGYDKAAGVFIGRGSYVGNGDEPAEADMRRMSTCGEICPPGGAILVCEKVAPYDPIAAELGALREAVRHARSRAPVDRFSSDAWTFLEGLACYDRWIAEFRDLPDRGRTTGDAYCRNVFRSTHRAGAGFLREIAPRYPRARGHLHRAADHLEDEVSQLDSAETLLGWGAPEEYNRKRSLATTALLRRARSDYAAAIDEIAAALGALGVSADAAG